MATHSQISAWSKLETLFGNTQRWRRRTSNHYFWTLDAHTATHHLLTLMAEFFGIKVQSCCEFGVRDQGVPDVPRAFKQPRSFDEIEAPTRENPAPEQQPDLLSVSS
jgi:hypothetical protein